MVEITLKVLFESACKALGARWNKNRETNEDEQVYLSGCLLVWQTILQRLCLGCFDQDSEEIFRSWLLSYRDHLVNLCKNENSPNLMGQIDAFNELVNGIALLTDPYQEAYKQQVEKIKTKEAEISRLYNELDSIVWSLGEKHEM